MERLDEEFIERSGTWCARASYTLASVGSLRRLITQPYQRAASRFVLFLLAVIGFCQDFGVLLLELGLYEFLL